MAKQVETSAAEAPAESGKPKAASDKVDAKNAAPKKADAKKAESKSAKPKTAEPKTAKPSKDKSSHQVTIMQTGSPIGRPAAQRQTLVGLKLNKIGRQSTLEDTPAVQGMIAKVAHLVRVVDQGGSR